MGFSLKPGLTWQHLEILIPGHGRKPSQNFCNPEKMKRKYFFFAEKSVNNVFICLLEK